MSQPQRPDFDSPARLVQRQRMTSEPTTPRTGLRRVPPSPLAACCHRRDCNRGNALHAPRPGKRAADAIDVRPVELRRAVHIGGRRRQALLEPGSRGKALRTLFRLHPLRRRLPDDSPRLVKLRQAAGGANALNIVFITIDPANDGPREVGQYATLFNAPIIGLTGSPAQIDAVKKQFGIFAKPEPGPHGGMVMINHTATVLLFDRNGKFSGTISADEPDSDATAKLKRLVGA